MDTAHPTAHDTANHTALLLERAYRLALVLHGRQSDASAPAEGDVDPHAFEQMALAAELVALLDDARAGLVRRG
jgi:hypothetical protein